MSRDFQIGDVVVYVGDCENPDYYLVQPGVESTVIEIRSRHMHGKDIPLITVQSGTRKFTLGPKNFSLVVRQEIPEGQAAWDEIHRLLDEWNLKNGRTQKPALPEVRS